MITKIVELLGILGVGEAPQNLAELIPYIIVVVVALGVIAGIFSMIKLLIVVLSGGRIRFG